MINRRIIFSYSRNEFIQFVPHFSIKLCPEEFPRPPAEFGHYAYFIDFKTKEVKNRKGVLGHSYQLGGKPKIADFPKSQIPDNITQSDENSKVQNEIVYIVNALNNNAFFQYGTQQHWTICLNETYNCCYGQEGYLAPEFSTTIEDFISIPDYGFIDPTFFSYKKTDGNEYRVRLSDLLKQYFESDNKELRKKYLNACVVLSKSFRIHEVDRSASYLLMVSAIEALIEIEHENEKSTKCECCSQPVHLISKKFKSFIDKYGYEIDNKTKISFTL